MRFYQLTFNDLECRQLNSIYEFLDTSNSTPTLYRKILEEYKISECGNAPIPIVDGCCYSLLDQPTSAKLTTSVQGHGQFLVLRNSSLLGAESLWLKPNTCADGWLFRNQILHRFGTQDCQSSQESWSLDNLPFTHSFETLDTEISVQWIAYTPSTLLIPQFQVGIEYSAAVLFILASAASLGVVIYYLYKYKEKRTRYMANFALAEFLWFIWILSRTVYYFVLFDSLDHMAIYSQILNVFLNLATLGTVLNTCSFLVLFLELSKSYKRITYLFVVLVHLGLCGGFYLDYFRTSPSVSLAARQFVVQWQKAQFLWIVLLFVSTLICSFVVINQILKGSDGIQRSNTSVRLQRLHANDRSFFYLIACQVVLLISYWTCEEIKNFGLFVYTDRNRLAMEAFTVFFLVMHSIAHCYFLNH
ncbi:hypothetical protein EDD86DRAFT_248552 [Gorgonomyces haynaldii]|nr:hypothetical protein EDD86DRAFT_248552 [Gorgonomyces haynaldii]